MRGRVGERGKTRFVNNAPPGGKATRLVARKTAAPADPGPYLYKYTLSSGKGKEF